MGNHTVTINRSRGKQSDDRMQAVALERIATAFERIADFLESLNA